VLRYVLGITAGILSGIVFAAASVIQKKAVNTVDPAEPLIRKLIRSPLWLMTLALTFFVGTPLNFACYAAIGPTLPPALGAIGLVAVPVLARMVVKERPRLREYLGAGAVAAGVVLMTLAGLSLNPEGMDWLEPSFLLRAASSLGGVLFFALALFALGKRVSALAGFFFALSAGCGFALSNSLITPIAGQVWNFIADGFDGGGFAIAISVGACLLAINVAAIALSQFALRKGKATNIIPLQQVPVQLIPILLHVALYRQAISADGILPLVCGVLLLLAGVLALGEKTIGIRNGKITVNV
jgi:drug/metabolite transporter (DMT)-like permease